MHPLYRKKSMDAVNEALLKPTEYPAADKDYNHPMWFKGTEPESIKTGASSESYDQACARAIASLKALASLSTDPDVQAFSKSASSNLSFFFKKERHHAQVEGLKGSTPRRRHTAEIDIHTGPENGGTPNMLSRSLLDEDAKEDIKENKGGYKRIGGRPVKRPDNFLYDENPTPYDPGCQYCGGKGETCAFCGQALAHCDCDELGTCEACGRKVLDTWKQDGWKGASVSRVRFSSPLFATKG